MDGLSAAGGIVSVVSLAVQLGQAACTLISFLNTIHDAPKEVIRLKDSLQLIHASTVGVQNALEYQARLYKDTIPNSEHICDALTVCQRRLSVIQNVLDKAENIQHGRTILSRRWASFKLAVKMDDIIELERQLEQSLSVLNILLTTNLMYTNVRSTVFVVDKIEGLKASYQMPCGPLQLPSHEPRGNDEIASVHNDILPSTTRKILRTSRQDLAQTVTTSSHHDMRLPWLCAISLTNRTQKTTVRKDSDVLFESKSDTTRYLVRPTFLSKSIELVLNRSGNSTPSLHLSVIHIIPQDVFENNLRQIIRHDDVEQLQQAITNGECTIDSCLDWRWNNDSRHNLNLLAYAEFWESHKIASFLHQQGCAVGPVAARSAVEGAKNYLTSCERFRYLCSRLDLWEHDPHDLVPTRSDQFDPTLFLDAIDYLASNCLRQTFIPSSEYLGSLLCILLYWWGERVRHSSLEDRLDKLVLKLVKIGADIYHTDQSGRTPLQILVCVSAPDDDTGRISDWLELLKSSQVSVDEYLQKERLLWPAECNSEFYEKPSWEGFKYACVRPRKIVKMVWSAENQHVSIAAQLDSKCSVALLLEEFNFCPDVLIGKGDACHFMCVFIDMWQNDGTWTEKLSSLGIYDLLVQWNQSQDLLATSDSGYDDDGGNNHDDLPEFWYERCQYFQDRHQLKSLAAELVLYPAALCRCDIYGNYIDLWPFHGATHTLCRSGNVLNQLCIGRGQCIWCDVHSCHFNHERFSRKQEKKQAKQMRRQGIKHTKSVMPGSWID